MSGLGETLAEWSFRMRNAVPWSAPAWRHPAGSWQRWRRRSLASDPAAASRLLARPDLRGWPALLSPVELDENLYLLDVLERALPGGLPEGRGLDVGSKNGTALPALVAATGRPFDLVELDAHRRYLDLSTRRAHGERLAAALPGCRYRAASVTAVEDRYAVVTWFLPFVHPAPLRAWGLPSRFFEPEPLLRHVCERVLPGGCLLVVNQGEGERDTQRELLEKVAGRAEELGRIDSALSPFRRPRYGFRWVRPR